MTEKHVAIANLGTNYPQSADRQNLLDAFADQPESNATWDTAYRWVRSEGDDPNYRGVASGVPAEELITMAETVRGTKQSERYDLMTHAASNGQLWFDIIEGFSPNTVREVLKGTVEASARHNQTPFFRTLDLGTGIGNSLKVLEENADQVVGVDRNKALLDIAKQRAGEDTTLVQADITKLPFEDSSFDLVNSLGVEGSLDKEVQIAFYTELARVMMPGGVYVSAFYNYPNLPSEEMAQIIQTSKAMLADMICDTVSGGAGVAERLDEDETEALLAKLGLHNEYYLNADDEKNHVLIQVVTKDREVS